MKPLGESLVAAYLSRGSLDEAESAALEAADAHQPILPLRTIGILMSRIDGATLDRIGETEGVTRERIRQICEKHGLTKELVAACRDHRAGLEGATLASRHAGLRREITALMLDLPSSSCHEIAVLLNAEAQDVDAAIPGHLRSRIFTDFEAQAQLWSQHAILQAIEAASTYEFPLRQATYAALIGSGELPGPSLALIHDRFGSWSKACQAAGVEAIEVVGGPVSTWSEADLLHTLAEYLLSSDSAGSINDYDAWRDASTVDRPSSQLLKKRIGLWTEAKRRALALWMAEGRTMRSLGAESRRVNNALAEKIGQRDREQLWNAVFEILGNGPGDGGSDGLTTLALGYVQSGKTTAMTALAAAAADSGYQVIVAMLGSTNLLLDQNSRRISSALAIDDRVDYRWVSVSNPSGSRAANDVAAHLARGRTLFIPLLKHAGRIDALAAVLESAIDAGVPVMILDDEADQASLNTAGADDQSKTYEAISRLREACQRHLYVQYTATPYAPLLLDELDHLRPDNLVLLEPGEGYIGGKEFFVDFAETVLRDVPALEEQSTTTAPLELPSSLLTALASFIAGAAHMSVTTSASPPVSMLVHSTARNDVQERYNFLIKRQLRRWLGQMEVGETTPPLEIASELDLLARRGLATLDRRAATEAAQRVLRECSIWLLNSASAVKSVAWNVTPFHILVGGNKLDRGFTVEGLTVTYLNRPASQQVDTLEQRARAFGYRGALLPYCQFFASSRTARSLRGIVFTEYDLRARLRDTLAAGGSVSDWATEIGLLLPAGTKPTRDAVVQGLTRLRPGWVTERRPVTDPSSTAINMKTAQELGLLDARFEDYGRLTFRTMHVTAEAAANNLLKRWRASDFSPGFNAEEIAAAFARAPKSATVRVVLIDEHGEPRNRAWEPETGFVNLFQGRDNDYPANRNAYPGDRHMENLSEDADMIVQVHRVKRRGFDSEELLALAIYLGDRTIVRRLEQ